MIMFAIACLAVWLAIVVYVARLEYRHYRLGRAIRSLRSQRDSVEDRREDASRAA